MEYIFIPLLYFVILPDKPHEFTVRAFPDYSTSFQQLFKSLYVPFKRHIRENFLYWIVHTQPGSIRLVPYIRNSIIV